MIVDPDFLDHWRTRLLADALGDKMAACYVLRIWAHCQTRRADRFEGMSARALKAVCRFDGDAELLEASLIESGYVERDGSAIVVPKWMVHNASLVRNWTNGQTGGRPRNPAETQGEPSGNPRRTQREPSANPVGTDKIREDKRREDIREEANASSCPAMPEASAGPPSEEPFRLEADSDQDDPIVCEFPCQGKPDVYALRRSKLGEYVALFAGLDVEREVKLARQWVVDNPSRRKTAKGTPAFIGRWLAKTADRGGSVRDGPPRNGQHGGGDDFDEWLKKGDW